MASKSQHNTPPSMRNVWLHALVAIAVAAALLVGAPSSASATEYAPGGGYCAAEFSSCSDNGSWCTWYGWCGVDIGGGGGGGGGGVDEPPAPTPAPPNCGRTDHDGAIVDGWLVLDLGTCRTKAICRAKRNLLNRTPRSGEGRAYCWANWNIPNSNGRHLVFAAPINGVVSGGNLDVEDLDPDF